ncbi:cysteine desulfurase-like protein [Arthrobacter pityocampae]|uniref:Cysteine desulfurase-like protein n=1 Tax=Arthrobacter pityocampae TaxID=547334 RepID=A0A2S5IWZ1_9MICC|nr:cysteine desulfurase-like protein [Arthrobacter pityocampae]PPB49071.1 cysteine desulfurase-like protein [Arthrobacter pityocampae]
MTLDIAGFRAHFPALLTGTAYFDGPGGTQTPAVVGAAIADAITGPLSNRGLGAGSESNAEAAVGGFRAAMADLLGAHPRGVVYGRSATQLTYDFSRHLAKTWQPGDEVAVSRLDHDSNIRPWVQAAAAAGATVRWIDFDPDTTEIDEASVAAAITERTKLVAITAASNLLGTKPPVRRIADAAHAVGALVHVDGVHYTAHAAVDVKALGSDFFTCSPYKFLGPHCGVLVADPDLLESLQPDKLLPSTNEVPERFEFGTLPYEIMAGATAAVDFLAAIAPGAAAGRRARLLASAHVVDGYELGLRSRIEAGLAHLGDAVTLHSKARDRTPTLLVTFPGRSSADAYRFLVGRNILAPAGSFYAYEAFRRLDLEDSAALRVGLAPYNSDDDVDRLLTALDEFISS